MNTTAKHVSGVALVFVAVVLLVACAAAFSQHTASHGVGAVTLLAGGAAMFVAFRLLTATGGE